MGLYSFFSVILLMTLLLCPLGFLTGNAYGLARIVDAQAINTAIKYGIQKQDLGIAAILGSNWIEGQDGSLLNIYTPFMMIATQASKKGAETTSKTDIEMVRKRMARILGQIQDPRTPQQVKFTVALYGDRPEFGAKYKARIEGEGRGKFVSLTPKEVITDKIANQNTEGTVYEAINAYYFNFLDLENLEAFRFIITSPTDEKVFTINDIEDIY